MAAKILLLDIETAPSLAYIWSLDTRYVPHKQVAEPGYTLCWAAKWLGQKSVKYMSVHHHGEEKMVQGVHDLLSEADVVVHYNGSKFDIPKLNQEFLKLRMDPPAPFAEVDLLRTARSRFKLLSNSLAYLCRHLDLEGKMPNKGMELWEECMDGKAAAWREMKAYNIQDVHMLEEVYNILLPWIQPHPNLALYNDDEETQCPKCLSKDLYRHPKVHTTQTMSYNRMKCRSCGTWTRERINNLTPEKRRGLVVSVK